MHIEKYTRTASGHMLKHYERAKDKTDKYAKFGNENIDLNRTHLNYNLAPAKSQQDFLDKYLKRKDIQCLKRENVNVMCDVLITVPKELPETEHKRFFKTAYDELCKRYGKYDNVVSSYVHLDETTPHMHFCFIPVVEATKRDKKTNEQIKYLKVSAKECVDRNDLRTLHPDMTKRMIKEFGYDIGIENGTTKGNNQTVEQLKFLSQIDNECKAIETKYCATYKEYEELNEKVSEAEKVLSDNTEAIEQQGLIIKKQKEESKSLDKEIVQKTYEQNFWANAFWKLVEWIMAKFDIDLPFIRKDGFYYDKLEKELNELYPNDEIEYDYE